MTASVLQHAQTYQTRGWPVLPLKPRSKVPAAAHGVHSASLDPGQATQWWGNGVAYGVAVACGSVSGFFALDVDPRAPITLKYWTTKDFSERGSTTTGRP